MVKKATAYSIRPIGILRTGRRVLELSAFIVPTAFAKRYTVFDRPEAWRFCILAAASLKKSVGTVRT